MEIFNREGRRPAGEDEERAGDEENRLVLGKGKAKASEKRGKEMIGVARAAAEETGTGTLPLRTDGLITIYIPKPDEIDLPQGLRLFKKNGVPDSDAFRGEDFYLGCDFPNVQKTIEWAHTYSLPLVWANPVKFIRSPERLALPRATPQKNPHPP